MSKWISMTDQLPLEKTDVLITDGESCDVGYVSTVFHETDINGNIVWLFRIGEGGFYRAKYWMPLPEMPE
jgi:hypothetical protein